MRSQGIACAALVWAGGWSIWFPTPGQWLGSVAMPWASIQMLQASPETLSIGRVIEKRMRPGLLTESEAIQLSQLVLDKSRDHGISPLLVLSLIEVESRFDQRAVSPKGARGLLQLMPKTAEGLAQELGWHHWDDTFLFDPSINLDLGLIYLQRLLKQHGDSAHAFTAYNMGPTALKKKLEQGQNYPPHYYNKILGVLRLYERELQWL